MTILVPHINLLDVYKVSYILTFDYMHMKGTTVTKMVLAYAFRAALCSGQNVHFETKDLYQLHGLRQSILFFLRFYLFIF